MARHVDLPRLAVAGGLLAALLQLDFLLQPLLGGGLPVTRSQVSELSATGQPYAVLYRSVDVVSGVLLLLFAGGWARRSRLVSGSVAVYAVGLALQALAPASCADSVSPTCAASELPGPGTGWQDVAHDLTSVASALAILVAGYAAARLAGGGRWATVLGVVTTGALVLGAVETVQDALGVQAQRGTLQRVQLVLVSALVVLLARPRGPRPAGAAAGPAATAARAGPPSARRSP